MKIITKEDSFEIEAEGSMMQVHIKADRWAGGAKNDNGDRHVVITLTGGQVGYQDSDGFHTQDKTVLEWCGNIEAKDFNDVVIPAMIRAGKMLLHDKM